MDINSIVKKVDHTLLRQTATSEDIKSICDEAIRFGCASVCIPPSYVKLAKDYVGDKIAVCTVIGFPNGYNTTEVKCYEAEDAVRNGADEIDMVINLGNVKEGRYEKILEEINKIKLSCNGRLLKVIIETCLLSEAEKIELCNIVSQSQADFIKTSTGFSSAGANLDDVKLLRKHCNPDTSVKAAGGISSLEDADNFIKNGADRLGTSRIIGLLKNEDTTGY